MLNGQHQRVDIPAHARTALNGLPEKRLGKGSPLNRPSCPPDDPVGQKAELHRTEKIMGLSTDLSITERNHGSPRHREVFLLSLFEEPTSIPGVTTAINFPHRASDWQSTRTDIRNRPATNYRPKATTEG